VAQVSGDLARQARSVELQARGVPAQDRGRKTALS